MYTVFAFAPSGVARGKGANGGTCPGPKVLEAYPQFIQPFKKAKFRLNYA